MELEQAYQQIVDGMQRRGYRAAAENFHRRILDYTEHQLRLLVLAYA